MTSRPAEAHRGRPGPADGEAGRCRAPGAEGGWAEPWRAPRPATGRHETAPATALLDGLPDPVFVLDPEGRFLVLSRAWEGLTGSAVAASLGRSLARMAHPDDAPEVSLRLRGLACGLASAWRGSFRLATPRRGHVWVEVHAAPQAPPRAARDGCAVARIVGTLRDVTFAREREADLRRLSLQDALLGIPNRTLLLDATRGPREAVRLALRMCRAVARPLILAGAPVALACSVGVVTSDVGFDDVDQLLGHADTAIYPAKGQGSGVALVGAPGRAPRRPVRPSWPGGPRLRRLGLGWGRRRFP